MSRITKKELVEALADYPDNAKVIFNDDENFTALDVAEIRYYNDDNDDSTPILCPENLGPVIFVHLKKHV